MAQTALTLIMVIEAINNRTFRDLDPKALRVWIEGGMSPDQFTRYQEFLADENSPWADDFDVLRMFGRSLRDANADKQAADSWVLVDRMFERMDTNITKRQNGFVKRWGLATRVWLATQMNSGLLLKIDKKRYEFVVTLLDEADSKASMSECIRAALSFANTRGITVPAWNEVDENGAPERQVADVAPALAETGTQPTPAPNADPVAEAEAVVAGANRGF